MKKPSILITGILVVCFFSLAWGARTTWRNTHSASRVAHAPQTVPVQRGALVADDMPIVLTALTLANEKASNGNGTQGQSDGPPIFNFRVQTKGRHSIKTLTFTLYDFDENGLLQRVESQAQAVDIDDTKGAVELTLKFTKPLQAYHRQILALERARSNNTTWQIEPQTIGRAVRKVSSGLPTMSPLVDQVTKSLPDDTGSILCSNGFSKAMRLAQTGDGQNVTSFQCDQSKQSYSFTFNGKDLGN